MQKLKVKEQKRQSAGRYRFLTYEADPNVPAQERMRRILAGEATPKRVSTWNKNLIVSSAGYGLNLIARQLSGDDAIPLEIAELQIGTDNTAAASGNTGLGTAVATGILRANQNVSGSQASLTFFVADLELPNGTYKELGIFCGNVGDRRLFARSVISPDYTKGSAEDTTIEYIIEFTAV